MSGLVDLSERVTALEHQMADLSARLLALEAHRAPQRPAPLVLAEPAAGEAGPEAEAPAPRRAARKVAP